jgi:hypothetical protein
MGFMSLMAELGLDWSPFKRGFSAAGQYAKTTGKGIGEELRSRVAGAFSGAAIVNAGESLVRKFIGKAVEIKQISKELGLTTDQVQRLQRASSKEHIDFSEFGSALEKINTQRKEAAEGNKGLRDTFSQLGVSLIDLQNPLLSDFDILLKLAGAVEGEATPAVRAFFKELAGRRAGDLIPALAHLNDDFKPMDEKTINSIYETKYALEELERAAARAASGPLRSVATWATDHTWERTVEFMLRKFQGVIPKKRPGLIVPLSHIPAPGEEGFIGPVQEQGDLYKDQLKIRLAAVKKELQETASKALIDQMPPSEKAKSLSAKIKKLEDPMQWTSEKEDFPKRVNLEETDPEQYAKNLKEAQQLKTDLSQMRMQTAGQVISQYQAEVRGMRSGDSSIAYGNFLGSDPSRELGADRLTDCKNTSSISIETRYPTRPRDNREEVFP